MKWVKTLLNAEQTTRTANRTTSFIHSHKWNHYFTFFYCRLALFSIPSGGFPPAIWRSKHHDISWYGLSCLNVNKKCYLHEMFYGVWCMRAREFGVTTLVRIYVFLYTYTTNTNDFYFVSHCFISTHKFYRFQFFFSLLFSFKTYAYWVCKTIFHW